MHIVIKI